MVRRGRGWERPWNKIGATLSLYIFLFLTFRVCLQCWWFPPGPLRTPPRSPGAPWYHFQLSLSQSLHLALFNIKIFIIYQTVKMETNRSPVLKESGQKFWHDSLTGEERGGVEGGEGEGGGVEIGGVERAGVERAGVEGVCFSFSSFLPSAQLSRFLRCIIYQISSIDHVQEQNYFN